MAASGNNLNSPQGSELTGLARFSLRFRLLNRLARSDDPILSSCATYLIRNKAARRLGLTFEFIFLILIPALYIIAVIWLFIEIRYLSSNLSLAQTTHLQVSSGPANLSRWTYYLMSLCYIIGYIVLLLPGNYLLGREHQGNVLRHFSVQPLHVLKKFFKLQTISFLIYALIATAFGNYVHLTISYFGTVVPETSNNQLLNQTWILLVAFLPLIFITMVSLFANFKYRNLWVSFLVQLGSALIYLVLESVIYGIIVVNFTVTGSATPYSTIYVVAMVINFLILFPIATFLSYTAILRCVMPAK